MAGKKAKDAAPADSQAGAVDSQEADAAPSGKAARTANATGGVVSIVASEEFRFSWNGVLVTMRKRQVLGGVEADMLAMLRGMDAPITIVEG